jgi:hypothetical protein
VDVVDQQSVDAGLSAAALGAEIGQDFRRQLQASPFLAITGLLGRTTPGTGFTNHSVADHVLAALRPLAVEARRIVAVRADGQCRFLAHSPIFATLRIKFNKIIWP